MFTADLYKSIELKSIIIGFYMTFSFTNVKGQKQIIDSSAYNKWSSVENAIISNDGKYVAYNVEKPFGSYHKLIFKSINAQWKLELNCSNGAYVMITDDSKNALFMSNDSLYIVRLGHSKVEYINNVISFNVGGMGIEKWLVYKIEGKENKLIVRNLTTGSVNKFIDVKDYIFSNNKKILILKRDNIEDSNILKSVEYINLSEGKKELVWKGNEAYNFVFNSADTQLAFISEENIEGRLKKSLWYFKYGEKRAILLVNDSTIGNGDNFSLDKIKCFSYDGNRLYITLSKNDSKNEDIQEGVKVDVWSYTDQKLQSQQLKEIGSTYGYAAVIDIIGKKIIRLEYENEEWQFSFIGKKFENVSLVAHKDGAGGVGEDNWNKAFHRTWYLVNSKNGKRKEIKEFESLPWNIIPKLSPEEKYIVYFDGAIGAYFSYEVRTSIIRNITRKIRVELGTEYMDNDSVKHYSSKGIAGWLMGDETVLLYVKNDIWQVDPLGIKEAINLTNGYGRKNDIVFDWGLEMDPNEGIFNGENLILSSFNKTNKNNGFFSKRVGESGDPQLLTMGPYIYFIPNYATNFTGKRPIKAKNADVYIVRREDSKNSPNFFSTTDFKTYSRISDLKPERDYNWFTTELHTWKTPDDEILQGVLYKPENFDPQKKYPIIFHYYERKSDELNGYWTPENLCNGCTINIPTYVSRGYLVFTPDISFKLGYTGESALKAVISAAHYISKKPWVNKTKMGLQGCSFGGFETNYIVTHSSLFAAACSASGGTDFISYYGDLFEKAYTMQGLFEAGQYRIGSSLWQRPDLYINNSPIFKADKVTTPLLIMATSYDSGVPSSQAMEFFTGLRRLGKKVWMLRYDDGNHGVYGSAGLDFSIRMTQFFDHYLKDDPAPNWMLNGIPATKKGIYNGFELDTTGRVPGAGLLR